jgi:hypothetical protein
VDCPPRTTTHTQNETIRFPGSCHLAWCQPRLGRLRVHSGRRRRQPLVRPASPRQPHGNTRGTITRAPASGGISSTLVPWRKRRTQGPGGCECLAGRPDWPEPKSPSRKPFTNHSEGDVPQNYAQRGEQSAHSMVPSHPDAHGDDSEQRGGPRHVPRRKWMVQGTQPR